MQACRRIPICIYIIGVVVWFSESKRKVFARCKAKRLVVSANYSSKFWLPFTCISTVICGF